MGFLKDYKIFIILIILIIIWALVLASSFLAREQKFGELRINEKSIKVEIVSGSRDTYRGLSGRESLCTNCGMLFDFKKSQEYSFVMREMNFPLDIVFILNNRIVNIYENLPPEGKDYSKIYRSAGLADTVLELNANFCRDFKIKVGDQINFLE